MCRQWVGGPLLAVDAGTEVSFNGEAYIGRYSSSDWAERGFCSQCGSALFYHLRQNGQYILPAGLFAQQDELVLDHQIFIDEKPHYYRFANQTHNLTGEQVFAQFAQQE